MPYVEGFENDIYIGYSMEAQRWASRFRDDLIDETELTTLLAKKLKVYIGSRDWELGQPDAEMLHNARESALFLAILTRDSLSDGRDKRFLEKEMQVFRESGRSLAGRFCPILLSPISSSKLLEAMPVDKGSFWNKNLQFYFHKQQTPIWLDPDTEVNRGEYKRTIKVAAYQLRNRLDDLRSKSVGKRSGRLSGCRVLLAQKEEDIEEYWNKARDHLEYRGATIKPDREYSGDDELIEGISEHLNSTDLFVQLLSPVDEQARDEGKPSLTLLQYQLAKDRGLPCMQWRRPDHRKEKFPSIKNWDQLFNTLDLQNVVFPEFLKAIEQKLEDLARPALQESPRQQNLLFIVNDKSNVGFADSLVGKFEGNQNWQAARSLHNGAAREIQESLDENLRECQALFVLYGPSPFLVDRQINRDRKSKRDAPESSERVAIVLVPPRPDTPREYAWSYKKVDCEAGLTNERIRELIA